nr:hypothetical protein [Tanacetum cinerariifolium]
MMEQQVWSLIEETLLVVVLKLMKLDRHVEELRMVSHRLEPDTVVDDEVLEKTMTGLKNCKSVEKVITAVVDTEKCYIKSCYLDKKRCDDEKEISLQELDKLQLELVVTLCLLEMLFPPLFFDIMIHLTVHLTREVKLCGPICFRWMYPFERYMKVIKGHVRNRNRPEGCIVEETIAEETIEFFSEYHKTMKTIGIPPDKPVTNENEDGKPLSAGKSSEVFEEVFQKVERELAISKIVYQKLGASVEAVDLHISKEVETIRKAFYYGVLQEIWVLDYRFRQIPLFKCDWVNHKAGGVKHDPNLGYTLVDLNSLGYKDDPFILALQAR